MSDSGTTNPGSFSPPTADGARYASSDSMARWVNGMPVDQWGNATGIPSTAANAPHPALRPYQEERQMYVRDLQVGDKIRGQFPDADPGGWNIVTGIGDPLDAGSEFIPVECGERWLRNCLANELVTVLVTVWA